MSGSSRGNLGGPLPQLTAAPEVGEDDAPAHRVSQSQPGGGGRWRVRQSAGRWCPHTHTHHPGLAEHTHTHQGLLFHTAVCAISGNGIAPPERGAPCSIHRDRDRDMEVFHRRFIQGVLHARSPAGSEPDVARLDVAVQDAVPYRRGSRTLTTGRGGGKGAAEGARGARSRSGLALPPSPPLPSSTGTVQQHRAAAHSSSTV